MKVRAFEASGKFTLYPLSDVHWPQHDVEKLEAWRNTVLTDNTALVTLGGDLLDFARGKYRAHIGAYTGDNNSRVAIDDFAYEKIESLVEFLRPVADQGKIIGTCAGNHYHLFANGRISDQEVALQLGIGDTWVGALGLFRIDFPQRSVRIALHHDAGRKGGTASADMLAFQHWSHAVEADIYIAGHTHRQYAGIYYSKMKIAGDAEKISDQKLVFIRSGAFLRGYAESVFDPERPFIPDYAEVAMLPPSVFGIVSVEVDVDDKGKVFYTLKQRTL